MNKFSLDSVVDIPCFYCKVSRNQCVIDCPFLDEFLEGVINVQKK